MTNYVVAGGNNFLGQVARKLDDMNEEYNLNITEENIKSCFSKVFSKLLISFGQGLSKNTKVVKNKETYKKQIFNLLDKVHNNKVKPNNLDLFLDSGGYQISIGYLEKKEVNKFIDMYIDFLNDYESFYNYAFSLDIPPNEITFDSYDDIYKWNKDSYKRMLDLSPNIRDKIIYVYHFRTPKVNEIWSRFLFEDNLAYDLNINRWAVGGVVAGLKGEDEIPYISYALPLALLLDYTIQRNKKYLHFHVLGGSTYRDILFYEICKLHIKKLYDVEIQFTFDSSGLFKQFMMGRFLDILGDDLRVFKLSITSKELDQRHNIYNLPIKDVLYSVVLNDISKSYNLPDISTISIYEYDGGPLSKPVELYCCIYLLHFYYILQNKCREIAKDIYELFHTNRDRFNLLVFKYLQNLNRGVISKRLKSKTVAFSRSLELISELNRNKINGLIEKYMEKDEFKKLVRQIATF